MLKTRSFRGLAAACALCAPAAATPALAEGPAAAPPPPLSALAAPTPVVAVTPAAPAKPSASLTDGGLARVPDGAPAAIRRLVAAGNAIAHHPYVYGGGHTPTFEAAGYDCSGSVSFALHGGDLLDAPLASGALAGYGEAGPGRWITIYANGGHTFMTVAGLRFDTSAFKQGGSRWTRIPATTAGYVVRHPAGL